MRNITVSLSDESYYRARLWAARHDTSLTGLVRSILDDLPRIQRAVKALASEVPQSSPSSPISINSASNSPSPSA